MAGENMTCIVKAHIVCFDVRPEILREICRRGFEVVKRRRTIVDGWIALTL